MVEDVLVLQFLVHNISELHQVVCLLLEIPLNVKVLIKLVLVNPKIVMIIWIVLMIYNVIYL